MKKRFSGTIILSALAFAAWAQNLEVIEMRQNAMETIGKNMKSLSKMAKGETEFNADEANAMLAWIAANAEKLPMLFPDDSQTGGETEAAPTIWQNRDAFDELVAKFISDTELATQSNPQDAEALQGSISLFAGNCKECHKEYRIEKD